MKIKRKFLSWALIICIICNFLFIVFRGATTYAEGEKDLQSKVIKVACIGDSITAGHGLDKEEEKYPYLLGTKLGSGYLVENYGADGRAVLKKSNAPYWKDPGFTKSRESLPDIVIIMLGTNDARFQYWEEKSSQRVSDEEFVNDYKDLINAYKELESHPEVYVCLPPTVYNTDILGISSIYLQKNVIPLIRMAAEETNSKLIDVNSATANMPENFPDKVHPNAAGAEVIANTIYEYIINDIINTKAQDFINNMQKVLYRLFLLLDALTI